RGGAGETAGGGGAGGAGARGPTRPPAEAVAVKAAARDAGRSPDAVLRLGVGKGRVTPCLTDRRGDAVGVLDDGGAGAVRLRVADSGWVEDEAAGGPATTAAPARALLLAQFDGLRRHPPGPTRRPLGEDARGAAPLAPLGAC